jgi:hypothetical protein
VSRTKRTGAAADRTLPAPAPPDPGLDGPVPPRRATAQPRLRRCPAGAWTARSRPSVRRPGAGAAALPQRGPALLGLALPRLGTPGAGQPQPGLGWPGPDAVCGAAAPGSAAWHRAGPNAGHRRLGPAPALGDPALTQLGAARSRRLSWCIGRGGFGAVDGVLGVPRGAGLLGLPGGSLSAGDRRSTGLQQLARYSRWELTPETWAALSGPGWMGVPEDHGLKQYAPEFKADAVALYRFRPGVTSETLRNWFQGDDQQRGTTPVARPTSGPATGGPGRGGHGGERGVAQAGAGGGEGTRHPALGGPVFRRGRTRPSTAPRSVADHSPRYGVQR